MLAPVGRGACVLRRRRQHTDKKKARGFVVSQDKIDLTCLVVSGPRAALWVECAFSPPTVTLTHEERLSDFTANVYNSTSHMASVS